MIVKPNNPHVSKIFVEHFEVRYPKNWYTTHLIQYLDLNEELIEDKIFVANKFLEPQDIIEFRRDGHGLDDPDETFEYAKYSTFTSFFRTTFVDTPRCFRKTKSVRRKINEIDVLKMNNYLMRQGKRQKTLNLLIHAWLNFRAENEVPGFSWKAIYLSLDSILVNAATPAPYSQVDDIELKYGTLFTYTGKLFGKDHSLTPALMKNVRKLEPMFAFYIYKVDKKIFKNTRGKSGKYTFIWKYVAAYKRSNLVLFWLMRELRMKPGRTFYERLYALLKSILASPYETWMWRARRFANNYVYYNCRNTLADTYQTTTK